MTIPRKRRRRHFADSSVTRRSSLSMMMGLFAIHRVAVFVLLATSALAASFQLSTCLRKTSKTTIIIRSTPETRFNKRRSLTLSMSPTDGRDKNHLDDNGDGDDDDDEQAKKVDGDSLLIDGPEKSLMTNYISQFLLREAAAAQQQQQQQQQQDSAYSKSADVKSPSTTCESSRSSGGGDQDEESSSLYYTHLLAIPLDNCHELLLELESIQRAIVYHCPVLVHACIPQAITRLPLLYVRCASAPTSTSSSSSSLLSTSTTTATQRLGVMVQEVLQKHGFLQNKLNSTSTEKYNGKHVVVDDDEDLPNDFNRLVGTNDSIRVSQPLMLNFSTLEVDGNTNQVLQTVAKETDASTRLLQQMVYDLQHMILQQEPSWKTMLPPDPHRTASSTASSTDQYDDADVFRPRIPFMRLPHDWDEIIRQQYKQEKQNEQQQDTASKGGFNSDDDDDEPVFLTSDQGGNGISPIFWCQWWHDEFPESRMREVAIYRRQQKQQLQPKETTKAGGLNEQTFYMPEQSIPLPMGSDALTKQEIKFQDYQEQRMLEAEGILQTQRPQDDGEDDGDDYGDIIQRAETQQNEKDPLFVKTRHRLESLYQQSSSSWVESNLTPSTKDGSDESEQAINEAQIVNRIDNDTDMGALSPLSEKQPTKPKPASNDDSNNGILDEWTRERIRKTVASRAKVQSEKELSRKKDNLPPIAENDVFTKYKEGTLVPEQDKIKQELSVTTRELPPFPSREHCLGFWRVLKSPTGFDVEEDDCDPTRSDNLVLCVDGTIAGGPILDQETRQKASGGTWRLSATASNDDGDATLRIRLVIPPKKDRILVMQGKLSRLSSSLSGSSFSMPSSTFSIPALEEKRAKANQKSEMITCQGEVWLEDVVTGYNRKDVGTFSLIKLETPSDPKAYTITIPRPVRNQD
jgi:hypothetical protein